MAWLLFLDESGQDRRESPYEVLAGLAIEDRQLWKLIQGLKSLQKKHFGIRLFDAYGQEAKAQKLLKRKVYKHAEQSDSIELPRRTELAKQALTKGEEVRGQQLTALGQAKIAYVEDALSLCLHSNAKAFASIIPNNLERPTSNFLRKDYTFLFERFYHFLNKQINDPMEAIVFDELDKQQSQIIVQQMEAYFLKTKNGRFRSRLIIPEPLFVHSDLTTMIQMADLIAYIISWGVQLKGMAKPKREELKNLSEIVCKLRYASETEGGYTTWGFKVISTLMSSQNG
jgi:Protein of unknown function (DUF3800)